MYKDRATYEPQVEDSEVLHEGADVTSGFTEADTTASVDATGNTISFGHVLYFTSS